MEKIKHRILEESALEKAAGGMGNLEFAQGVNAKKGDFTTLDKSKQIQENKDSRNRTQVGTDIGIKLGTLF